MEQEIPLPPERDSSSPTPTAPKPVSLKCTRGDLLTSLKECEGALRTGTGMDIVESATATIRLAQRYRSQVPHEDWDDEKKLRRDAVDVLVHLRRIAERDGENVAEEEKTVVRTWCKDVGTRVERDDEVRRGMWERAASWMDGEWEGKEWGTNISTKVAYIRTISSIFDAIRFVRTAYPASTVTRIAVNTPNRNKTLSHSQPSHTLLPPSIRSDNSISYRHLRPVPRNR